MTKDELSQLRDLRQEIAELTAEIAKLSSKGSRIVVDKVSASAREFPYIATSVKIEGYDYAEDNRIRRQITKKEILLRARRKQAEELECSITEFINSVPDSRIRRMMEYKYINGYTWKKIGRLMHCDRTTAEKAVSNYLDRNQEEN